jgi:hypothetical protein
MLSGKSCSKEVRKSEVRPLELLKIHEKQTCSLENPAPGEILG